MDRLFDIVQLRVREDAEMDGTEGDCRGVVRFGGGDIEGFSAFGEVFRADQLHEGLDPVRQAAAVLCDDRDAGFRHCERVPVSLAQRGAVFRADPEDCAVRLGRGALRKEGQFGGVAGKPAPQRFHAVRLIRGKAVCAGSYLRTEDKAPCFVLGEGFRSGIKMLQIHVVPPVLRPRFPPFLPTLPFRRTRTGRRRKRAPSARRCCLPRRRCPLPYGSYSCKDRCASIR